ncbi:hypothetical protein KHA80_22985 [Anaerobacillus sp. HL2]|nr:hypothetical protein KHA80_22985 [Anaerobacillus sp. HL2]
MAYREVKNQMKNFKFALLCLFTLLLLGACSDSNKENETSDSEAIKQLVHDYSTAKLIAEFTN